MISDSPAAQEWRSKKPGMIERGGVSQSSGVLMPGILHWVEIATLPQKLYIYNSHILYIYIYLLLIYIYICILWEFHSGHLNPARSHQCLVGFANVLAESCWIMTRHSKVLCSCPQLASFSTSRPHSSPLNPRPRFTLTFPFFLVFFTNSLLFCAKACCMERGM